MDGFCEISGGYQRLMIDTSHIRVGLRLLEKREALFYPAHRRFSYKYSFIGQSVT